MFLGTKQFFKGYDPGAAYAYGRLGDASGQPVQGRNGVETAGASATVTATNGTPFDPVTVGSIIVFCSPRPDGKIVRTVTAKASGASITVDSAVTLSAGTAFFFWPFKSGTSVDDGWHNVNAWSKMTVFIDVTTLASTTIEANIEVGGGPFSAPVQANTTPTATSGTVTVSINAVGRRAIEVLTEAQSLRVGLRVTGGPAVDAVSVWAVGEMLQAKGN
jgi:hypothetical protein